MENTKNTTTTTPQWIWYALAVFAVLLSVPDGTIVKIVSADISPVWMNAIRFSIIVLVTVPFIVKARHLMTRRNLRYALLAGVCYAVSVTSYTWAVSLSQASYVSVLNIGVPLLLMMYSVYLVRERVTRRSMVGIAVAALGAFVIVGTPFLLGQGLASEFHPLATLLGLLACASFPLIMIFSRRANETGLPLVATFGIAATIVVVVSLAMAAVVAPAMPVAMLAEKPVLLAVLVYSAVGTLLLSRALTTASYRRIGSVAIAGLSYLELLLGIIVPILILGEHMTVEMFVGGLLVLAGVMIVESHHRQKTHVHRVHGHHRH